MKLKLKIWRQKNSESKGKIIDYDIENISPDMSFLEMLDVLNADLISKDEDPVSFDHDCREGICVHVLYLLTDRHMVLTDSLQLVNYI